ncbi:hypothetical protein ACWCXX_37125 [Streptomyces sp. NPDC001732]
MKNLRDELRARGTGERDPRERRRHDEDRDRRATEGRRVGGRPEGRRETDLDERNRLARMSRVAERPFG